jgi:UDP-N-acetylglucosamine 2-epimerase (non-hydrolysing)/GDP/UDP-N,N'-diacetylbacillosamine 2-epimerase (hydrolysing)
MTRVAVVTVARSDYSILTPVLRRIVGDPALDLELIVAGMHLAPEFGLTIKEIEADGFQIRHRVEMLLSSDTPLGTAKSMGLGLLGFAEIYAAHRPDTLLITGDRFEMFVATAAALPFRIPIAHIHGGELSEGAIDDAMRHAISKMSHLHFVSTEEYRRRVIQLGESPDRVIVSGAPALDNLRNFARPDAAELERRFGIDLAEAPLIVTFHPTTLEPDRTEPDLRALLSALDAGGWPIVFTAPNADADGRRIGTEIARFAETRPRTWFVANLGLNGYYGLLHYAAAMVGNSSSGIIEAASFGLPVVNIGNRQRSRLAGANVVHVAAEQEAIERAIKTVLDPAFRAGLLNGANPYGDGDAAPIIVEALRTVRWTPEFCAKRFHNLPAVA